MNNIEVMVLNHNLDGTPLFLAKLTQRGHEINSMHDVFDLYNSCKNKTPSSRLIELPHTTIQRMCHVTIAIVGLSTKAVSQLRTHAKRATFLSTSTQYSSFEGRDNNFVYPPELMSLDKEILDQSYEAIMNAYQLLLNHGVDKDQAGYLLPQSLRKALIIDASIDEWNYILSTRLCHRNTEEVQYICSLIYKAIADINLVWVSKALPKCAYGSCPEGKFCCGKPFLPVANENQK